MILSLALALTSSLKQGGSQYTSVPFTLASRSGMALVTPSNAIRYTKIQLQDRNYVTPSLLTYLNNVNPTYWSFGTDFTSVPQFFSGSLRLLPNSGVPALSQGLGMFGGASNNLIQFRVNGNWRPEQLDVYPPVFDGKNWWVVVVRESPLGVYTIIPSSATPSYPSYYNLQAPGGQDSLCSNGYDALGTPFTKYLQFIEHLDASSSALQSTRFHILYCNWSVYTPYVGVTIRDALQLDCYTSGSPINTI